MAFSKYLPIALKQEMIKSTNSKKIIDKRKLKIKLPYFIK
jgi:hypothetical protein